MDNLENFMEKIIKNRIEILEEYVQQMTEHQLMIKESEKIEDYEDCNRLYKLTQMIDEVYLINLSEVSYPSKKSEDNNRDLMMKIKESVINKVFKR